MNDKNEATITPRYILEAMELHLGLTEAQVRKIATHIAEKFLGEIEQCLEGNIDYPDAPFFEAVDTMYEASQPKGCYFCDPSIDANEKPFDYPNETRRHLELIPRVCSRGLERGKSRRWSILKCHR